MKRAVIISSVTALAIAFGAVGASAKGFGGKGGFKGPRINFEEVDANADGLLSKEELAAHAQVRFDAVDTDGNGSLSVDELSAARERADKERLNKMIERRDTNKDGALSFDEMKPNEDRVERMFERLDKDGDGNISSEEFAEMKAKRKGGKRGQEGSDAN